MNIPIPSELLQLERLLEQDARVQLGRRVTRKEIPDADEEADYYEEALRQSLASIPFDGHESYQKEIPVNTVTSGNLLYARAGTLGNQGLEYYVAQGYQDDVNLFIHLTAGPDTVQTTLDCKTEDGVRRVEVKYSGIDDEHPMYAKLRGNLLGLDGTTFNARQVYAGLTSHLARNTRLGSRGIIGSFVAIGLSLAGCTPSILSSVGGAAGRMSSTIVSTPKEYEFVETNTQDQQTVDDLCSRSLEHLTPEARQRLGQLSVAVARFDKDYLCYYEESLVVINDEYIGDPLLRESALVALFVQRPLRDMIDEPMFLTYYDMLEPTIYPFKLDIERWADNIRPRISPPRKIAKRLVYTAKMIVDGRHLPQAITQFFTPVLEFDAR